ncbi:MAG: TauD/TfdA family dioxygenase [Planctomycetota bacterium]
MDDTRTDPPTKRVPPIRRRSLGAASFDWVSITPHHDDAEYPTRLEPKLEGIRLHEWAHAHRQRIQQLLTEKRALLFRGFDLGGAAGFGNVVDALSNGPRLPYRDRSTPRIAHGDNIYCTTMYPPDQTIRLHNEGSYWSAWPLKAFFGCVTAPPVGGETPIGDVHRVHERIDPDVRREFDARRWMLVRNYHDGFALPWQDVFQTSSRSEVEQYCGEHGIELEWLGPDRLRTRQVRAAIQTHPWSGEPLWFNHAAFFHVQSREPALRDALLREFGVDELPYQTFFGDGVTIPDDVVRHINDAYEAERTMFRWQPGDLHLIDNMRLAHARQPYQGDRLILVALTEAYATPSS